MVNNRAYIAYLNFAIIAAQNTKNQTHYSVSKN